jgi:hypothetical protein
MTLKGWNDEYAITITPLDPQQPVFGGDGKPMPHYFTENANRPLLSKRMEYRQGDVTAFIEPKDDTENEFDIDFTLHSKPNTNVFTYKIEGADDFDFAYQPELSPEDVAEGAERPENVVGSYAVYHKTQANHKIGSTNYATGKAFHIYRPKAIDANGAEMWSELSYEDGILSVTVPQKFLDDAAYPVRVDPTFGYTSVGGTGYNGAGDANGTIYSAPENGDITALNIWLDMSVGTSNFKGIIYNVSSDYPSSLAAVKDRPSECDTTGDFELVTLDASVSITSGTPYYLGVATVSSSCSGRYDTDASVFGYEDSTCGGGSCYNTPQDPFTASIADDNQKRSIYATYTADAGGGETTITPSVILQSQLIIEGAQMLIN